MIYFFHHYELPAILQQIRIQEMLLQNQQAGQGNQTALQDNLNNNTTSSPAAAAAPPGPSPARGGAVNSQVSLTGEPQAQGLTTQTNGLAGSVTGTGDVTSDLDWMAETAAIITEALSSAAPQLGGSLLESAVASSRGGLVEAGGAGGSEAGLRVVAELRMEGVGGGVGGSGGGESVDDASPSLVTVEIQTIGDSCSAMSTQGSGLPLPSSLPIGGAQKAETTAPSSSPASPPHTDCSSAGHPAPDSPLRQTSTDWDPKTEDPLSPDSPHPTPS